MKTIEHGTDRVKQSPDLCYISICKHVVIFSVAMYWLTLDMKYLINYYILPYKVMTCTHILTCGMKTPN